MKKIYFVIALLAVLLPNTFYSQCSLYPVSLPTKVTNSSLIIEGKVISQTSFWNAGRNYIYTSNLISVNQIIKGSLITSFVEIITEGGQIDLNKQVVDPSLQLGVGDEGIFTLNSFNQPSQNGYPVYHVYADQQGFIKFDLDENIATVPFKNYPDINNVYLELETLLGVDLPAFVNPVYSNKFSSSSSIAAITGISPTIITAGTFSVLTITGSSFGATQGASIVEFKNADDGGATFIQPHSSQYVSWSNTQIQVIVPTRASTITGNGTAGTGQVRVTIGTSTLSVQTLTVTYGELNVAYTNTVTTQAVFDTRHIGLNTMNGINWQMFTSFDANTNAKTAFLSAFQTWRCNTSVNWL
ncbi:MAG: IPT/TIG domain-containing protein, partial [Bacteroidia bacterium]